MDLAVRNTFIAGDTRCAGEERSWALSSLASNGVSYSSWAAPPKPLMVARRVSMSQRGFHRQGSKWSKSMAVTSSTSTPEIETEGNAKELVDELLLLVDRSDRGVLLNEQDRCKVEQIIERLEQQCIPEPLKSPLLFGEWDVVYSSNPTSTGGYYRSALGRALLNTKQMMQIVNEPDSVSNKVSFAALGIFDGEVSLQGKLEVLDKNWIKIKFESPELKIGSFDFQYGGQSSVKIAIIYLDERVRLGRGSRGSLFVFRRR
ncbi:hypothetical protein KP509_07G046600 [Ceratopteris richardii]|uniref:Plastid lipid-associated protein/fibrillin conserved domain-containing protein n=1 Tax=Ceratopteris richardii TaxID=49495 RepID=A0A8T2UC01_CERRI|nr:hypothetical protein KP509_07G046600 [Ceratopteris richardii]